MKLSEDTLSILNNFSMINQSLYVEEGNVLRTIAPSKTFLAKATLPDFFPVGFSLYQLKVFLNMYGLMEEPDVTFDEKFIYLKDEKNGRSSRVRLTGKEMILAADYSKDVTFPSADVEFSMPEEALKLIQKANMGIVSEDEIALIGKEGKVFLSTYISQMENMDDFRIELGETDRDFVSIMTLSNLKLLKGSYHVRVSFRGIVEFNHTTPNGTEVVYWTTISDKSKVQN